MLKELQNFGLSEKEAKVYLATLELGKASVQQISKKSQVNRATTYVQLESLKNRGLVSLVEKDKKTLYIAESPDKVKKLIEKEKVDVLFKENEFNKILPNLEAIYNVYKDRPNVRFYEGREGVEAYRQELLKRPPQIMNIITPIYSYEDISQAGDAILSLARKIKQYKLIYAADKRYEEVDLLGKEHKHIEVKYLPMKKLEVNTEIMIGEEKLWIYKQKGVQLGIVIEDKMIAESFQSIFNLFWSIAK